MKPRIVVIGRPNADMVVQVANLPAPGETILGEKFLTVQGGKGANQAVVTARSDQPPKIGDALVLVFENCQAAPPNGIFL
jgi:sugar/nucleoside kinase (ribokinase family)